jgi:hypothetical protein
MPLSTPSRIRNRINASASDISDAILSEYIEDEQANVEKYAKTTFSDADPDFGIARSICTDRCAARALLYSAGISAGMIYTIDELRIDKSDPAANKLLNARELWAHAEEQLSLLKPASSLRPKASTS